MGADRYPFKFRLEPVAGDPLDLTSIHFAMAGAAAIVLLIACANLANLMLARWEAKRRDTALRLAMGAKRSALIVQRFVEGLLLAAAGGVIGLLLTAWMVDFLAHNIPRYGALVTVPPHISWRVIAFGFLAAALTSVLFGLGPAFRMTEVTLNEPLKDGVGTTTARARRYSAIVVAEVALSLALLLGATLLTRAVIRAARYDFGYETRNLFSMSLGVNARQVGIDSASADRIMNSVANRVRLIPGVRRAATVHWSWPVGYMIMSDAYNGAGGYLASNAAAIVSPDFLGTLGIRVVQGRDFLPGDQARGAAILDEDAARELFGARVEAVGRSIKLGAYRSSAPWLPVVGVVERANITGYRPGYDRPTVYVASDQYPARRARLVMRVEERNAQASLALRSAIRGTLPPGADAGRVTPYAEYFERDLRSRRFIVRVFLLFSAFALGLAGVGVYGVVAYGVNARLREFAVRVALGAESLRVFKLVLHDGAVMLLAGTGLGAFAAMWCAQILDAWLYDVYFVDATSLIVAEAVLLAAGFAACIQPALRATQADPVEMLRAT